MDQDGAEVEKDAKGEGRGPLQFVCPRICNWLARERHSTKSGQRLVFYTCVNLR